MTKQETDISLTWDLSTMYPNQDAYDREYMEAETLLKEMQTYEGHIADSLEHFIRFMELDETLSLQMDNLFAYPQMATDSDPEDEIAQQNLSRAYNLFQKINVATTFVPLEMIKEKATIEDYLKQDVCKDFRYPMEELYRTIPHRLDDEKEAILAQVSELTQIPETTFQSFRPEYEPVTIDGKKEFLNGGNYNQFLMNKDAAVRKEAFEHYFGEYRRYQNVFMNLLTGNAKSQVFQARMRKYPSALEASLFQDGADKQLFDKVLSMSNKKYRPYLHEYFMLRKDVLQMEEMHCYDVMLPLVDDVNKTYTIEESFEILKNALAPLGEDYVAMLDTARKERWIDFLPRKGKRSGAYSGGTHSSKPYILTNFTGEYESLSTLAHEFGHSMHSYYSRGANRPMLSDYKIFVAEVASTVNELLLNDYLLKHSEDEKYKASLLNNLLNQLVGTIYRQPMFAEFEATLHAWVEEGKAISSQELTQMYYDLNTAYFGDSTIVDELQRYGCYYIPHFYYSFYVYKYTLGMSVAIAFTKRILQGDVNDYRTFLTKGGSEAPIDELINAGVDPREDAVYDDAFTYFKEVLDEFKHLTTPTNKV